MNDSAPPTLLDRLTRMDGVGSNRAAGREPASLAQRVDQLPVLGDLLDEGLAGSGRSHAAKAKPAEEHRATDFAITTVNVPDRLDLREVRDQAEEDYKRPGLFSFDRYLLGLWVRRIVWLTVLGLLGFWILQIVQPIRQDLAADRISQRLSASAGVPVQVADTTYRFSPSPRFVLRGVHVADDIRFDEVAIRFNWQDTWSAVRGGAWTWGEATVSPLRLTHAQAWSLLSRTGSLSRALPASLSILRFESIELVDSPLIRTPLEVVLRRGVNGQFGPLAIAESGGQSSFKLALTPPAATDAGARVAFQLDASDWALPLASRLKWNEVTASGFVSPTLLEVDSYSLSGVYGVVQGSFYAATDLYWVLTGYARGTGLDVESIAAAFAKVGSSKAATRAEGISVPFAGTATMNVALGGRGDALSDAVAQAVVAGPIQVRWAAINGINLGYAATHGGSERGLGGGYTRFSELDASIVGGSDGLVLRDIVARAGAMSTRGEVRVGQDLALSGAIRVDLGATRVQAPTHLRVRGTLLSPQFGR
jgi:hypothetical protein